MSYEQFPSIRMVQAVDTGEKLNLGGFRWVKNGELDAIRLDMYAKGVIPGAVSAALGLHLNDDFSVAYAMSDYRFLLEVGDSIVSNPTGEWFAMVKYQFNRPNINKNQEYFISLQLDSYTRDADNFYLSAVRDAPYPSYSEAIGNEYGSTKNAHIEVFAYVEPA